MGTSSPERNHARLGIQPMPSATRVVAFGMAVVSTLSTGSIVCAHFALTPAAGYPASTLVLAVVAVVAGGIALGRPHAGLRVASASLGFGAFVASSFMIVVGDSVTGSWSLIAATGLIAASTRPSDCRPVVVSVLMFGALLAFFTVVNDRSGQWISAWFGLLTGGLALLTLRLRQVAIANLEHELPEVPSISIRP